MPLFMQFANEWRARGADPASPDAAHPDAATRTHRAPRREAGGKKLRGIVDMHKNRD
jgi:hypothetical protein